ncbi:hypothetical protein [Paracoccus shandongensis]|uniref:hypothetical protein n=1 Tax=Paracoccus shandongensis TaxID=2816048 RepID=UPI001A8CFD5F|nr:hypothetical protein [Paracoccus shandongensis]
MKWVITGILAVSGAAALAGGAMTFSNDKGETPAAMTMPSEAMEEAGYLTFSFSTGGSPVTLDPSKAQSDMPVDMAQANDPAGQPGYTTFSNYGGGTSRGGAYTTRGGCAAYRAPEVEHRAIQGAASLRFLESAYIHQVAASIEAAGGKCTCELRFPTWDAALEELETRFMTLPSDESSAWVRDYANSDRSRLTREVDKLCKAQGVY